MLHMFNAITYYQLQNTYFSVCPCLRGERGSVELKQCLSTRRKSECRPATAGTAVWRFAGKSLFRVAGLRAATGDGAAMW